MLIAFECNAKSLVIVILVFSFSFFFFGFGRTAKSYIICSQEACDQDQTDFIAMLVAYNMLCNLEKIIMLEKSGDIQSQISCICGNITVFAGLLSSLPQYL